MEPGLAAAMAGGQGMQQTAPMRDVGQVVQMLKQGVSPEQLLQQGVPEELIRAAMEIVSKEATQVPAEQAGLAGMMTQQGM